MSKNGQMMVTSTGMVAGLQIAGQTCPKDGAAMFLKPCPCFLRKKGGIRCARCVKCGHQVILERRPGVRG